MSIKYLQYLNNIIVQYGIRWIRVSAYSFQNNKRIILNRKFNFQKVGWSCRSLSDTFSIVEPQNCYLKGPQGQFYFTVVGQCSYKGNGIHYSISALVFHQCHANGSAEYTTLIHQSISAFLFHQLHANEFCSCITIVCCEILVPVLQSDIAIGFKTLLLNSFEKYNGCFLYVKVKLNHDNKMCGVVNR